tara:strand:- start:260 stop:493 length:234 start_codon:yes stop_codon:yes gene_type:complete
VLKGVAMTPLMREFSKDNDKHKVVEGVRLTPEGKEARTLDDIKRSDRILYRLDNGKNYTLSQEDLKSAPDFTPDWGL